LKKNNIFILLSFTILPLILFLTFELLFYSSYKISNNKFFENFNEASKRKAYSYFSLENNFRDIETKKIKIAIFGGSIAYGYGLPNNFGNIIKQLNIDNMLVHNYSENGGVFSKYQSELMEILMPYYDYFIVYSGDNEIWANLCFKAIVKDQIILPDNMIIDNKCRKSHEKKTKKIIQLINNKSNFFDNFINFFKENSRFYLFINRILFKLKQNIPIKLSEDKEIKKFDYFVNEDFFNNDEKLKLINNFKISLNQIKNKLNSNQKLILIKPLSNDLIPPTFEHMDKKINSEKFSEIENYVRNNYDKILNNKNFIIKDMNYDINHLDFFKGIHCLKMNKEFDNCLKFLIKSRNNDKFPLRILKEIEEEIINSKNDKIVVINLDEYVLSKKDLSSYRSYFIDAQHLSLKSHLLIAREVLKEIYLDRENLTFKKLDECENYLLNWNNKKYEFINDKKFFRDILNERLDWQEKFMAKSDHKYNLNFFNQNTKLKILKCLN
tara:strand:- start:433 stop:1920 length:1488 start_codon:yes stop_codon:yes gene_type:complete